MRHWRQGTRPHVRRSLRLVVGMLMGVMLAWPLAAQEPVKQERARQESGTVERDESLKARGQAFWDARLTENYAAQYGLLEPKVQRQLSLTNYIQAQGPLQYLEARIEDVQIDEARAVLTVRTLIRIKYPPLDRGKQEIVVREEWVKRQGEWYRMYPQS